MTGTGSSFAEGSTDALFAAVYARLKAMAARQLNRRHGATLDTTELVHELYLRIGENEALHFEHPAQFFSYAARAMRHLLTNRARDRLRLRAGGQWMKVTLDEDDVRLALDTAAQALALLSPASKSWFSRRGPEQMPDLEYRTSATSTKADAKAAAERMIGRRETYLSGAA